MFVDTNNKIDEISPLIENQIKENFNIIIDKIEDIENNVNRNSKDGLCLHAYVQHSIVDINIELFTLKLYIEYMMDLPWYKKIFKFQKKNIFNLAEKSVKDVYAKKKKEIDELLKQITNNK